MYDRDDVITIPEMARRLKISKTDAYNMVESPNFPLYNLGGPRKNRIIWGEAIEWIRATFKTEGVKAG